MNIYFNWKPPRRAEFLPIFLWFSKPLQQRRAVRHQIHLYNFKVDALGDLHTKLQEDWTILTGWNHRFTTPLSTRRADARRKMPTHTSDFEPSSTKLGQSTTKIPLDLRNTASWEAPHKKGTTSDHSNGLKSPIYHTPIRGSSSKTDLHNLEPESLTNWLRNNPVVCKIQGKYLLTFWCSVISTNLH